MRVDSIDCPNEILYVDMDDVATLTKENLESVLCRFIVEVKKVSGDEDYPGRTLYQLACVLQNHLKKKKINWKLVHGSEFLDFNRVLDNVMLERSARAFGTGKKQAEVISMEYENELWLLNILGEDDTDKLRGTVLFLIGINCALHAGDEHYGLRRPGQCVPLQFSFERNSMRIQCLVFWEDSVTKTNIGGLKDMRKECKVVWIKPSIKKN